MPLRIGLGVLNERECRDDLDILTRRSSVESAGLTDVSVSEQEIPFLVVSWAIATVAATLSSLCLGLVNIKREKRPTQSVSTGHWIFCFECAPLPLESPLGSTGVSTAGDSSAALSEFALEDTVPMEADGRRMYRTVAKWSGSFPSFTNSFTGEVQQNQSSEFFW